jgi:hypothetical protein
MTRCFLSLPPELIIEVFTYLDYLAVLSFRQLNSEWKAFIDDDDVSRFFIHHSSFTFRGTLLSEQREALGAKEGNPRGHQIAIKHLFSRLRGLYSEGPTVMHSVPHPPLHKYCYGNNFLALETEKGEKIEITDIESQQFLFSIKVSTGLGEFSSHIQIRDMHIRESVLSVSLEVIRNSDLMSPQQGDHRMGFILFYGLGILGARLLLTVPFRPYGMGHPSVERCCLMYAHNAGLAVVCQSRNIDIWDLSTGELRVRKQDCSGEISAISMESNGEWALLRVHPCAQFRRFPPLALYSIMTYSEKGYFKDVKSIRLHSFPSDLYKDDWWWQESSEISFGTTKYPCDGWVVVCRQRRGIVCTREDLHIFFRQTNRQSNLAPNGGIRLQYPFRRLYVC